jgi:hypothetical protein
MRKEVGLLARRPGRNHPEGTTGPGEEPPDMVQGKLGAEQGLARVGSDTLGDVTDTRDAPPLGTERSKHRSEPR